MVFDYSTLRRMANNGTKLGGWKGKSVFTCSKSDLKDMGSGAFYILYDDDNRLVGRSGSGYFYEYGIVNEHGNVQEYDKPKTYTTRRTSTASMALGEKEAKPQVKRDTPVGDVKVGLDVEAVLRQAREMTVADLLKGFNYGL